GGRRALHSFPTRRSSDLVLPFPLADPKIAGIDARKDDFFDPGSSNGGCGFCKFVDSVAAAAPSRHRYRTEGAGVITAILYLQEGDRKSTRLNSSHVTISY